ncbi:MAG: type I restriction-modification system subunit M N-terminal domain-containing protein [Candidatus Phytoplasma sp. TWB_XP]
MENKIEITMMKDTVLKHKTNDNCKRNELYRKLWRIADDARKEGLGLEKLKGYLLPLLCLRYLSEKFEIFIKEQMQNELNPEEALNSPDFYKDTLQQQGFFLKPEHYWTTLIQDIKQQKFSLQKIHDIFTSFAQNSNNEDFNKIFQNLFTNINSLLIKEDKKEESKKNYKIL